MNKQDHTHQGNHCRYLIRFHVVIVTKFRKRIIGGDLADTIKRTVYLASEKRGVKVDATEPDGDHLHIMADVPPTMSASEYVALVKQCTTWNAWQFHKPQLSKIYWGGERMLWGDGYWVSSIGDASPATVERYIREQGH
jgi:putative transposase